ncbi:5256_t:CDS:2 [Diversispora eburnea]|uniref:5256_t:CDS:1 n=1 Tax=Diversispora eburnea TaxID=1213867 RepID=A0A9N9EY22_9GLOM|nr:5256_t:CDS:2 [Diversispora eburnea]
MCRALINRIEVAEQSAKSLKRKRQENAAKFLGEEYYRAWVRFTNVLKNIKDFAEDVIQQSVIRKYLNANAVKEAYDKNIKEFEDCLSRSAIINEFTDGMKNISQQINILSEQLPVPTFPIITPFEDGIKAHKKKQYKEAWEYFNEHADLGLSLARYWKGYYLVKGYLMVNISNGSSENYDIILKYMKVAADGGSGKALYNLSDIYLHGKFGVEKMKKKEMNILN